MSLKIAAWGGTEKTTPLQSYSSAKNFFEWFCQFSYRFESGPAQLGSAKLNT